MNILETYDITKNFGGLTAVNRVNIEVPVGSIISIIGPNGAGKTTFFNCITGFYSPDDGDIIFDGKSLLGFSPNRVTTAGIARTYQNIRLFPTMTAIENILVGQHPRLSTNWLNAILHTKKQVTEEKNAIIDARKMLNFIGLNGMGDYLARNLPYGAQRRLEIARALASKPKLLLLDEPTAGMNPERIC